MFIIEADEVRKKLTMEICMDLMKEVLSDFEQGKCVQPIRSIHLFPQEHMFGFMPAWLGDGKYFGAKIINACHRNMGTQYPSHAGYVMMFEATHGMPLGLVDASTITQIRTGAVSGVATDLLASKNADTLALIGAGAQAYSHMEAICLIRDIKRVQVYDRNRKSAELFKETIEKKYDVTIRICDSAKSAVEAADIICTLTPSKEPFLELEWIKSGAHINAVGTFTPTTREISSKLMANVKLYADSIESMKKECGEFLIPKQEGLFENSHICGSIGGLLNNTCIGRSTQEEITLFDALGLAIEDVACGKYFCNHC